ncbi:hypothetical protein CsSME_00010604 [Camellia sinensis var. sinensis]
MCCRLSVYELGSELNTCSCVQYEEGLFHIFTDLDFQMVSHFAEERRFQEAEDDCTEALNLDDRYIKAYSRRSTARKELGKLKESIEDAEFALRLEPHNQEIKKQYAETKSLYEKEILNKASGALRSSMQKVGKSKVEVNKHVGAVQSVSRSSQKIVTAAIQEDHNKAKKKEQDLPFYEKLIPMFNVFPRSRTCHSNPSWGRYS